MADDLRAAYNAMATQGNLWVTTEDVARFYGVPVGTILDANYHDTGLRFPTPEQALGPTRGGGWTTQLDPNTLQYTWKAPAPGPLGLDDAAFAGLAGGLTLAGGVTAGLLTGPAAAAVAPEAAAVAPEAAAVAPEAAATGGITASQVLQAAGLANTVANVAQNPSGQTVGGLIGGLTSAATGVPALSLVGSTVGGTIDSPGGSSGPGGNPSMASNIGPVIAGLIGLAGGSLSLADQAGQRGKENTAYDQLQALLAKLMGVADRQQSRLDTQYTQQQDWYSKIAALLDQNAASRQAISGRLADPAQVTAGAQALYQPMADAAKDELLRSVSTSLATRGITSGGAATKTLEEALAPYIMQQQQLAMQNYLRSQTDALKGYSEGPFTPAPPAPPGPAQYPKVPTYIPGQQGGGAPQALQSLANLIGGTNGNPGLVQAIANLVSPHGNFPTTMAQTNDPSLLGDPTGQGDPFGSDFPTNVPQFDPSTTFDLLPPT